MPATSSARFFVLIILIRCISKGMCSAYSLKHYTALSTEKSHWVFQGRIKENFSWHGVFQIFLPLNVLVFDGQIHQ